MFRTTSPSHRTRPTSSSTSLTMSAIGKGNHIVRDAIRGKRGEKSRTPELVEQVHNPGSSSKAAGKGKDKNGHGHGHGHVYSSSPAQAMGIDVSKSVAANRPATRRKKTRHVDEFICMNGNQFMCSLCGRPYQSLRAAREHMKLKHPVTKT